MEEKSFVSPGLPNVTVTLLIEHQGRFLMVNRGAAEENFPDVWAFPGGKVELGETIVDTIRREVQEETGLGISDETHLLDTYGFKRTVGVAFIVRARTEKVILSPEFSAFRWIKDTGDLEELSCIPGIYNHLVAAKRALQNNVWDSLEALNLTPNKYINDR